jgi:hypothetical protein
MFKHTAIRKFHFLLRSAMMGAREVNLQGKFITEQAFLGIMSRIFPLDWKQWAKDRPWWVHSLLEAY